MLIACDHILYLQSQRRPLGSYVVSGYLLSALLCLSHKQTSSEVWDFFLLLLVCSHVKPYPVALIPALCTLNTFPPGSDILLPVSISSHLDFIHPYLLECTYHLLAISNHCCFLHHYWAWDMPFRDWWAWDACTDPLGLPAHRALQDSHRPAHLSAPMATTRWAARVLGTTQNQAWF